MKGERLHERGWRSLRVVVTPAGSAHRMSIAGTVVCGGLGLAGRLGCVQVGEVTKLHEFIGFGDIHGPKTYEFMGFVDIHGKTW